MIPIHYACSTCSSINGHIQTKYQIKINVTKWWHDTWIWLTHGFWTVIWRNNQIKKLYEVAADTRQRKWIGKRSSFADIYVCTRPGIHTKLGSSWNNRAKQQKKLLEFIGETVDKKWSSHLLLVGFRLRGDHMILQSQDENHQEIGEKNIRRIQERGIKMLLLCY